MGTTTSFTYQNITGFRDSATYETVQLLAPIAFYDDFTGADMIFPDTAAPESGVRWVKKTVSAFGTVAKSANTAGGIAACAIGATEEKQEAALYVGDQCEFDITKNVMYECRCRLSVVPTLAAEIVFGLIGAWADGLDTVTHSIFFTADGSGEIFCEVDDNVTDQSATSGVTVADDEWHIYRIQCGNTNNIRFYIDGEHVADTATFAFTATGTNAVLQPYLGVYKASGAGVGTVLVDYVRIWATR